MRLSARWRRKSSAAEELNALRESVSGFFETGADRMPPEARDQPYIRDEVLRRRFYSAASYITPIVGVDTEEGRFLVPTRSMGSIGRSLFTTGRYAGSRIPRILRAVEEAGQVPPRGGTFLDIGANIGTVVIPAVRRYGFERGVAFEPHPANVLLLRLNVELNGMRETVQTIELALGDEDGLALMRERGKSGTHRVLASERVQGKHGRNQLIEIRLARLDSLMGSHEIDTDSVTLMWIDVQGSEAAVLRGATELLRDPPLVVTEFSPKHLESFGGVEPMVDVVQGTFSHAIDLDETLRSKRLVLLPVSELRLLANRLASGHTDLALLRLQR